MPFTETELDAMIDSFNPRTYTVRLDGVESGTLRGVFRRRTEVIGQGGEIVIRPSIRCKESALEEITRRHTLTDGTSGITYKIYGDFDPSNSGLATVALVKA